jgi:type I restriction enzyme, R subunit
MKRPAKTHTTFAADGGFTRLNRVFDGEVEAVQSYINEELWKRAG